MLATGTSGYKKAASNGGTRNKKAVKKATSGVILR